MYNVIGAYGGIKPMLINLTELFSVEGKAKRYVCELEFDRYEGSSR